ncbi:hypothetical protein QFC20_002726 [Naganishia adeliensis]|uniref:Uncharacterized protein n=1 Tax=Naganishia adeliensis TaxID=92952 RepID=A0ACC2WHY4_9TREE|nr:hypothetical protein QFC20_002726 [Naganishia adeliensis]
MLLLPLLFATTALAATTTQKKRDIIYSGASVNGQTYDYVIAGGGLAGMVLAGRLSEDANRRVLVIEAGYDEESRSTVTDPSQYQQKFGTWRDWQYLTTPQQSANNAVATIRAGRMLGGSTGINGLAYTKPHTFQLDAMQDLGNAGVNWDSMQVYMKRAEGFSAPTSGQAQAGITYNSGCHGSGGPIAVRYDPNSSPQALERAFNQTVLARGEPYAYDLTCGNPAGAGPVANTRDVTYRIDAFLSGANVGKVILSSSNRATGVEFRDESNALYTVNAALEVIMATGAIKTPSILQQSGIGPASVLQGAGVGVKVDLPVGMNLVDQVTSTTTFGFSGQRGGGQVITFPRFQDLVSGADADRLRNILNNNLASYASSAVAAGAYSNAAGLQKILEIQRDWILNRGAGMSESFDYSYGSTLGYDSWFLLSFTRGSVQIKDNNAYGGRVDIDPRYFGTEFDSLAQAATARYTRLVSQAQPLSGFVTGESAPGGSVPNGANLDAWVTWVKANFRSNWHPAGTASMMSRDLGGVVDSRYKAYGTTGLRVVDASILGYQVSSHLMSVLYGFAERAADIIKQDNSGVTPPPTSTRATSTTSQATSTSSQPASTGVAIHPTGNRNKCLDVAGNTRADGTAVDLYDCNDTAAQKWVFTRGTTGGQIRLAGSNYCLDAGSNPGNGIKMKIWTCYAGLGPQTWTFGTDGRIRLPSADQCLDVTDGSFTNFNVMQTWQCSSGNTNQQWAT